MSIESVMPSNHLMFCHPFLLLPSIFPSITVFSKESVLHIRWPKYWHFSFSISPSNEYSGLTSFRMDWLDLLATPQFKSINYLALLRSYTKHACILYRMFSFGIRELQLRFYEVNTFLEWHWNPLLFLCFDFSLIHVFFFFLYKKANRPKNGILLC